MLLTSVVFLVAVPTALTQPLVKVHFKKSTEIAQRPQNSKDDGGPHLGAIARLGALGDDHFKYMKTPSAAYTKIPKNRNGPLREIHRQAHVLIARVLFKSSKDAPKEDGKPGKLQGLAAVGDDHLKYGKDGKAALILIPKDQNNPLRETHRQAHVLIGKMFGQIGFFDKSRPAEGEEGKSGANDKSSEEPEKTSPEVKKLQDKLAKMKVKLPFGFGKKDGEKDGEKDDKKDGEKDDKKSDKKEK